MTKEAEAFEQGYRACMEDVQRDIAENMLFEKVEFLYVDAVKRTAEFAIKLKEKVVDI